MLLNLDGANGMFGYTTAGSTKGDSPPTGLAGVLVLGRLYTSESMIGVGRSSKRG